MAWFHLIFYVVFLFRLVKSSFSFYRKNWDETDLISIVPKNQYRKKSRFSLFIVKRVFQKYIKQNFVAAYHPTPCLYTHPTPPNIPSYTYIWLHRSNFYEPTIWCCYAKVPFNAEFSWKFDFSSSIFVSYNSQKKKKRKMKRLKYQKVPFFESQTHSAAAQPVSVVTASQPCTGYPGITVVCCHVVCYYYWLFPCYKIMNEWKIKQHEKLPQNLMCYST